MYSDFALWLMQQPKETQLYFFIGAVIILLVIIFYYCFKEE